MNAPARAASDDGIRERIRTSLDESMIVEASAGTGKTSELVRRIVGVLASGSSVQGIVAVTFTHKAAGELKIRLRQGLDEARGKTPDAGERASLEHALAHLEEASIGTIHSFCAQILRERPVEAHIDPEFGELTDIESSRLQDRAFDQWFQQKLNAESPGLRRALARLAWRESWESGLPIDQLKFAARKLIEWRDFPAPWKRQPIDRDEIIDALLARVQDLAALSSQVKRPKDNLAVALQPARVFVQWVERAEALGPRDYDMLEALLLKLQRDLKRDNRKGSGQFADAISRQEVVDRRTALLDSLELFRKAAGADLAAEMRAEMQDLIDRYQDLKQRAGKLDFLDLLLLARDLVRDNQDVRGYLQKRFSHIFIDEFQDTDPLQAEILVLLSADNPTETDWMNVQPKPGKLFVVGDPKQSIYKFRRADVTLYETICERLRSRGVAHLTLTTSYRSVRTIQHFVNAAFENEMTGDIASGQARYSPLEEHWPAYDAQPPIVALPAPRPYGTAKIAKTQIDACLPDTVAAFIEWLVKESQWQVRDPAGEGQRVPLQARHICVLFRRFVNFGQDITREYVRALEARGIPHLLVGSRSFHDREEVETMRAAIAAIEWPDDELSVFATLKGALFAIPDDLLLRFRHQFKRMHPFRTLPADLDPELAPIRDALSALADLHRSRNWRPIADTINDLLERTRAHAGFALRPAGAQVLANVSRVCDLARTFEISGGLSFRGFVEEFGRQAERAESAEAPVLEEASDGIRLMTVHTAKGLEFPVVILADMTANLTQAEPDRYIDARAKLCATRLLRCAPWELLENEQEELEREKAEGVRVAYVAATRARDLLVVPVVGDEERDGWLAPLNKAVYPRREAWRHPKRTRGCPAFHGDRTVLDRPMEYTSAGEFSVKPGLHSPVVGEHEVVWWDPAGLRLKVPEAFGLHQEDILAAEPADRAAEGIRSYRQWLERKANTVAHAGKPQFDVVTPTEIVEPPPIPAIIGVESLPREAARPGGSRFGTLLHAVIRDLDFAAPEQIAGLAAIHGKLVNAAKDEIAAAEAAIHAVLSHPLMERSRKADRVHRELPLSIRLDDGRLIEGTADLAFLEGEQWTVVDFKSDAFVSSMPARYERQLQWYVFALAKATGRKAQGVLLKI
jgi:ATP-dependent exoDNAse (exonuclease V) beta subunit